VVFVYGIDQFMGENGKNCVDGETHFLKSYCLYTHIYRESE